MAGWVVTSLGVALAVGSFLLFRQGYSGAVQSAESMKPTLRVGERFLIERIDGAQAGRGDVVAFSMPERYRGGLVVKRVIGTAGDRVVSDGTAVSVNGSPLAEPYVWAGDPIGDGLRYDVTVPEGRLFLLGDNRGNSLDSRYFRDDGDGGTVPVGAVEGRVLDDVTVPVATALVTVLGTVAAFVGAGCGLAGWLVGRRRPPVPLPVHAGV